jgi:low temperature requirement protein LtrA
MESPSLLPSSDSGHTRAAAPKVNPWWQPPRLRSVETDGEERHATWLELFFDLVFVAAISQLSYGLKHNMSMSGIVHFVILAVPIWWAWTGVAFYATRFDTDDLSDRIFYCLQMIGVAALAVNVHDGLGAGSVGFALAYAFIRALLVLQYFLAAIFVPEARSLAYRYAAGFGIAALCWLLSAWVPLPQRFILWGAGLVIDFWTPLTAGKLHSRVPPHNAHISERYGLFMIVVLGESILGAVSGVSERPIWHALAAFSGIFGMLVAFCLWWLYFDHASSAPARAAKDEGKLWLYQIWLYSHLPLMIGLSAVGVAIEQAVLVSQRLPLPDMIRWLLFGGAALSFAAIGTIHMVSCYFGSRLLMRIWLPYVFSIAIILWLGFWQLIPLWPFVMCALLAAICIFNVVIHIFLDRHLRRVPFQLS